MVNMNNDEADIELDVTNDENIEIEEPEIEEIEELGDDKIKKMRDKVTRLEEEKKQILDEAQRAKADFLNARKRLEDERARDRIRYQQKFMTDLLPLCDSFQMAMSDTEAWEKADEAWRTGVEKIHTQLLALLEANGVTAVSPEGEPFSPHQHEAIGTEVVEDEKLLDTVVSVVQRGYEMKVGDKTELIRPARVTTGISKD